ncbi:MAG: hypothetical protein KF889_22600 [Alphaproteobacteria bacterium]|nr:hypothetical protein [Alphaproteobacteria bacterium]MCW5740371.1 hypothetical protein [Alphaproteobacteria bacterium]
MRSPLWFVLAAIIGVGGFVAGGFHLFSGIGGMEDRLMQVVVPGSATLNLSQPGTYTIYHESQSVVDGRVYAGTNVGGLRVAMRGPDGSEVKLVPNSGGMTYKFGSRKGHSIFTFAVSAPGEYRITGTLPDGRSEPKVVLAIESGLMGGMARMIGGAIGLVFGGLAIAGIIVVLTLWQRQKARRA